jgi:hypothetical protein
MHEFDKCHFCTAYDPVSDSCIDIYCEKSKRTSYILDVNKILAKADEHNITVTDVLNLMREVNV